jgi:transcriptional regulator with XRE-family HTH domain
MKLGATLAQRIALIREFRALTVKQVADGARFSAQRIEDLEAGLETWLSASDRQLLAKALSVEPKVLQEVEVRHKSLSSTPESKMFDKESKEQIAQAVMQGGRDVQCPDCGNPLKCSLTSGFDIDGNPIFLPKAYCPNCPFVLR